MKKSLFVFFTATVFCVTHSNAQTLPSYVPTSGLLRFYPFSGTTNDVSGNNLNGTNYGCTYTTDRYGNANGAINSASNGYVSLPISGLTSSSGTISFWVSINSLANRNIEFSIGDSTSIAGYSSKDFSCWVLEANYPTANLSNKTLFTYDKRDCAGLQKFIGDSASKWTINTWVHITIVSDGTIKKIYRNGINITPLYYNTAINGDWFSNMCSGINYFWLGRSKRAPSEVYNFSGKIDEFGLWNRALTQSEITTLFTGCADTITTQPTNLSGTKGSNQTFSFTHTGTGNNYQWQSNPIGFIWQNVPNANQYSGATTNSLAVNNLTVSNHNQFFRVISSKSGCADTSNIVKLTISDVATDSLRLIQLQSDSISKLNAISALKSDTTSKGVAIRFLQSDTTNKGITIRQLQTDLANKHDTVYIASSVSSDTLKISIHTGISITSPTLNSLKVYPNPASTLLNIVLEKPGYFTAKLSGVTGQSIITPTIGTIDISLLANGVYILTIYDSNGKLISTNKVSIIK